MKRKYLNKYNFDDSYFDVKKWPQVYIHDLTDEEKYLYIKKKEAVTLFIETNIPVNAISKKTGIQRQNIYKLVDQCLSFDEDNNLIGFAALKAKKKNKRFSKTKKRTRTGEFKKLLLCYPELETFIEDSYLSNRKVSEKKQTIKTIHLKFLNKCRELGIKEYEYPFNTTSVAIKSLSRFIKSLQEGRTDRVVNLYGPDSIINLKNTNNTVNANTQIYRPFERVEFDGHLMDSRIAIVTKTPQGKKIINVLDRIWILVVIDVATRAILGYHIAIKKNNYSANDVSKCFKNSLIPWTPKEFTLENISYNKNAGFPSGLFNETKYAIWDEILFDNALAHMSDKIVDNLLKLGCSVNFGKVKVPQTRSRIERFFRTFEESLLHRLPTTTGSHPYDPIKDKPEEHAVIYEVTLDEIEQLIEAFIANYNSRPHNGLYGATPLEAIESRVNEGIYIRKLNKVQIENIDYLFATAKKVRVNGNIKDGRRPYINFSSVRYSSDKMNNDFSIVGKNLILNINEENIQYVTAYNEDGSFYDILIASKEWGTMPHSLQFRKEIIKFSNSQQYSYTNGGFKDLILAYEDYLNAKSVTHRKERLLLQQNENYKKEYNIQKIKEKQEEAFLKTQTQKESLNAAIIERKKEKKKNERKIIEKHRSKLKSKKKKGRSINY